MRKHLFLLVIALLTFSASIFAQGKVVSGTVIADDGQPLIGATVLIKGTTNGTTTNVDGQFSIDVSGFEEPVLVITYIGYLTEEIVVGAQTQIEVRLATDLQAVDEVVVVGYGVQKKSLVTGSISKVKSEDIVKQPSTRVEQALQSKIAGVTIAQNSGTPGAGIDIKIRGVGSNRNTAPLFIVDGMRTGGIEYLDPNDIESMEVLKDAASAAIYGAEGGNGVIIISTKKGKKGSAEVSYNGYYGVQQFQSGLKMMDADQYADYFYKATVYETQSFFYTRDGVVPDINDPAFQNRLRSNMNSRGCVWPDSVVNRTNWMDQIIENAPIQSHNLSISGGSDLSTYSASMSYFDQDGVIGGDKANFKRYTFRLNGETKPTEWLTVGAKMNYSLRKRPSINENNEFGGVVLNAMFFDPTVPVVYNDDSEAPAIYASDPDNVALFVRDGQGRAYGMSTLTRNEIINPIAQLQNSHQSFTEDKVLAGGYIAIEPLKGLTIRSTVDLDLADNLSTNWIPMAYYSTSSIFRFSDVSETRHRYFTWQWENYANYQKSVGKNNFSVMAGYSISEYNHNWLGATGRGLIREDENFAHIAFVQGDTLDYTHVTPNSGWNAAERMISYYGRANYNYNEQILFNYTIRRDGSSLLAPAFNLQTYHSGSLGYVLSNAAFWNIPLINYAKVRYSLGSNGNKKSIDRSFYYAPLIGFNNYIQPDANESILQGAVPLSLINEELKWESVVMHDVGLDLNLLNNKFGLIIDYYVKTTKDLLMTNTQIPGYVGNRPPFANIGDISNKGLEIELTYRKMEGDLKFDVSGNITFLSNVWKSMITEDTELPGANLGVAGGVTRSSVGEPVWYFYGYKTDGVWQTWEEIETENFIDGEQIQSGAIPGDIRIVDVNQDSAITNADKTNIGVATPKMTAGLTFNMYYKSLDLGITMSGVFGSDIYNGTYRNDITFSNKPEHFYTDAWSPENTNASWFRPNYSSDFNLQHNDFYVEDGSYVKLKNVQLGYTLPTKTAEILDIKKLRIYVSGSNLLTFTKYRGADPEIGDTGNNPNSVGIDRGFYPQARLLMLGLNVTF